MQNKIYNTAKSRLGFGCMRLPLDNPEKQGEINLEKFNEMVDAYLASGFNYFDTAYLYNDFQSENAIRESLVKRHKRDSFTLADKMPTMLLQSKEDVERIFNEQLVKCGVEYFDYYLIHNLSTHHYEIAKKFDCFEFVKEMKRQGKIRHIGFSYHDDAILLEKILNEHPEVEFVQIQLNYIDWENESIQSRKCYETIRRHNLPAIIMEPLKGGALIRVPNEVRELFLNYETSHGIVSKNPGSPAAWGLRFAASHDRIMAVLSGMSTIEQMEENLTFMKDFKPMTAEEFDIIKQATDILNKSTE
ncbi:MAG: aldo/keto reductase, partial [Candidatus Kapabacteria bacterium]|nr:aldo/keto reductase [Candidatus Kapabacteria bacterium]